MNLHETGLTRQGFNGAGVLRPRKFLRGQEVSRPHDRLQWGRGLKTPEINTKENHT